MHGVVQAECERAAALARAQQEAIRAATPQEAAVKAHLADAACQSDELRTVAPAAAAAAAEAAGLAEVQLLAVAEFAKSGAQAWQGRAAALEAELAAAQDKLARAQQACLPLCL